MGARLASHIRRVERHRAEALVTGALLKEMGPAPGKLHVQEQVIATLQAEPQLLLDGPPRYDTIVHAVSATVPPFSLMKPRPQTSGEVMLALDDRLGTLDR